MCSVLLIGSARPGGPSGSRSEDWLPYPHRPALASLPSAPQLHAPSPKAAPSCLEGPWTGDSATLAPPGGLLPGACPQLWALGEGTTCSRGIIFKQSGLWATREASSLQDEPLSCPLMYTQRLPGGPQRTFSG